MSACRSAVLGSSRHAVCAPILCLAGGERRVLARWLRMFVRGSELMAALLVRLAQQGMEKATGGSMFAHDLVCRLAGLPVCQGQGAEAGLPVCRFASLLVCQFAGLPVCRFASLPVCQGPRCRGRFAGLSVCQGPGARGQGAEAGLPVCRFAGLPVCRSHASKLANRQTGRPANWKTDRRFASLLRVGADDVSYALERREFGDIFGVF